jgi:hypothetical protein
MQGKINMSTPEGKISDQCRKWLTDRQIFHYRNNTQGIPLHGRNQGRFRPSLAPGAPDLVAILSGKYIGIELKAPGKIQSDYQKDFQQSIERAGGRYILAYSLGQLTGAILR